MCMKVGGRSLDQMKVVDRGRFQGAVNGFPGRFFFADLDAQEEIDAAVSYQQLSFLDLEPVGAARRDPVDDDCVALVLDDDPPEPLVEHGEPEPLRPA